MSSLHAGSPDVRADVEKDHVDRDSEPGSEDSDINVDSNFEIKFCLNMMSMEKALQSATAKVEAGSGNWKWTNLTCTRRALSYMCSCIIAIGVTRRKLQTPGNAEEHKRQETPTINPIGPTDKPHRPSTKHYRKDSPGDA